MKKLPEVYFKEKNWYIDERLKEIRDVNNPHDKISFEDIQYLFFELFPNREIKILEKKLELSKRCEERLCSDHCGKQLGHRTGCIACDVEYFLSKRIGNAKTT